MTERVYKSMKLVGAANIALGIIVLVTGVATGILAIIGGSKLLKSKNDLTF